MLHTAHAPAPATKAGKVTFNVKNTGATMHQFAIGADPLTLDGGEPAASAAIAKGEMLHTGDSEAVSAGLKPGKYVLYCLMGGHYAAGQRIPFTVSG